MDASLSPRLLTSNIRSIRRIFRQARHSDRMRTIIELTSSQNSKHLKRRAHHPRGTSHAADPSSPRCPSARRWNPQPCNVIVRSMMRWLKDISSRFPYGEQPFSQTSLIRTHPSNILYGPIHTSHGEAFGFPPVTAVHIFRRPSPTRHLLSRRPMTAPYIRG